MATFKESRTKLSERFTTWIVPPDQAQTRLDRFLSVQIAGESRSQIQNWIRKGYVQVNGKPAKTGYAIKSGDNIELRVPSISPDLPFAEDIPLSILYEDPDLAIIEKPAGLVCHLGAGHRSGTLVNALLYRMGQLDTGDPLRPGIVHRLDKFTSGVMLVAKNSRAHRQLSSQFKERQVKKEYLALVYGRPTPPSGTISLSIGRDPHNRKKFSSKARRTRTAITHYRLEKNYGPLSLLRIQIETGRTHQIRVHLSEKGYPIVGDTLYGSNRLRLLPAELRSAAKELHRPFLHSCRLEFKHPFTGKSLSYSSPLPVELQNFLELAGRLNDAN
jgi:23S rRNA pseudouridine1911/1915/1917 synthase